jgi:hypothetical protein
MKKRFRLHDNVGVKYEEGLPLPYVKYELGNWVLEFGDGKGNYWICECFVTSIENYIEDQKTLHRKNLSKRNWEDDYKTGSLSNYNMKLYRMIREGFDTQSNICHRCNQKTPSVLSCHPMYGGTFIQTYGWYVSRRKWNPELDEDERKLFYENQKRMELLRSEKDELINKYFPTPEDYYKNDVKRIPDWVRERKYVIEKEDGKLHRKNMKMIENLVRGEFGYKPIGEMWVNETILYKLVKELFPSSQVIHHYRGKELEGLEIDVFVKEKKIGFEYNGLQHYKPIKHFGGKVSLNKTKERDKRKKELCNRLGIELHIIKYDETITKELIKSRLSKVE